MMTMISRTYIIFYTDCLYGNTDLVKLTTAHSHYGRWPIEFINNETNNGQFLFGISTLRSENTLNDPDTMLDKVTLNKQRVEKRLGAYINYNLHSLMQ